MEIGSGIAILGVWAYPAAHTLSSKGTDLGLRRGKFHAVWITLAVFGFELTKFLA